MKEELKKAIPTRKDAENFCSAPMMETTMALHEQEQKDLREGRWPEWLGINEDQMDFDFDLEKHFCKVFFGF